MKLGALYIVQFLDHSRFSGASSDPLPCEAIGRLTNVTKKHLEIVGWRVTSPGCEDDSEGYVVLRSCITKIRELR